MAHAETSSRFTPTEIALMAVQRQLAEACDWNVQAFIDFAAKIDEQGKAIADLTIGEYLEIMDGIR